MKFSIIPAILFPAILFMVSSSTQAEPPVVFQPKTKNFTSIALCEGQINDPTHTNPSFGFTVEAYSHSEIVGPNQPVSFKDPHSFVTHVHRTTNNFFRRDAERAKVISNVEASGVVDISIETEFLGCLDCYKLTITNGPGAGKVLTGTIQFQGSPTLYTLDCGTVGETNP